jgi:hypothetical protein
MTVLDPDPTLFGTGRIDPLVASDGSTEYSRAILWINNRAARISFGAYLRVLLLGDPIAAYNVGANWQPLADHVHDMQLPIYGDIEYEDPPSNWSSME